jgi:ribonucleotide monophosphatase NagD (HAD superfamily)
VNPKGLLIDLDGTLYVEDAPIPGAREAFHVSKLPARLTAT